METRTERLPKLQARALFQPELVSESDRTAELVWTAGAGVQRGFWTPYWEVLSMDPAAVDLTRLNNGAPLLNSHNQYDLGDIIGVVEKAWLVGDEGRALVRFPKADDDPEADKIFRKVKDGIIRNVSVGYVIHEYDEQSAPDGEIPTWLATAWEPVEISLVPVPADAGAGTRALPKNENETFEVKIRLHKNQEDPMDPKDAPAKPAADENKNKPAAVDAKAERAEGMKLERARVQAIHEAVRKADLGEEFAQEMIEDGRDIDAVRALVIDKWAERGAKAAKSANAEVTIVKDARENVRSGMEDALMFRGNQTNKLTENGRRFAGLTLRELARESLRAQGINTEGMGAPQIAERAFHTTSDFPGILSNVVNKSLRRGYEEAPITYGDLVTETDVPDFKQITRFSLGEAPQLEKVLEDGEIQRGTLGDSGESYKVETYAKIIAITRQVLINDDMDVLTRIPASFGAAAKSLIADLVWEIINSNPIMGDGKTLFHADHGNLVVGNPSIMGSLTAMRAALKKQKGESGRFLNLLPSKLIVGTDRETEAEGVISPLIIPQAVANVNSFARTLGLISDPRLDDGPYYMAANKSQVDIIEIAYLEGTGRSVYTEQRMGFDVEGLEIKARLDVGAKALDWRGLVKNPGVTA